jgi:hypothetical protein
MAYLDPKGKGDKSMPGNHRSRPDVWGGAVGGPRDMAKLRREALCCIPDAVGRDSEDCSWIRWLTLIRKVTGTAAC